MKLLWKDRDLHISPFANYYYLSTHINELFTSVLYPDSVFYGHVLDISTRNKSKIFAKFPLQYSSHLIKYVTLSEAFIVIISIS